MDIDKLLINKLTMNNTDLIAYLRTLKYVNGIENKTFVISVLKSKIWDSLSKRLFQPIWYEDDMKNDVKNFYTNKLKFDTMIHRAIKRKILNKYIKELISSKYINRKKLNDSFYKSKYFTRLNMKYYHLIKEV